MRMLLHIMSAVAVMGLAYWAYNQNYRTQDALDEVASLQRDIAQLREDRSVLRAEWAYLNRPDRLLELADINFDTLGLMPLSPDQFARVDQIAYPTTPLGPVLNPIDVIGLLEDAQ